MSASAAPFESVPPYLSNPGKERELSRLERSLDRDDTAELAGVYDPSTCCCCIHDGETVSICVSAPMTMGLPWHLPGIPPCPGATSPAETCRKAARTRGILESAHLANSLFILDSAGGILCGLFEWIKCANIALGGF